jgi:hypothetical protein
MPYTLDAQLLQAVTETRADGDGLLQPTAHDDRKSLRERGDAGLAFAEALPPFAGFPYDQSIEYALRPAAAIHLAES